MTLRGEGMWLTDDEVRHLRVLTGQEHTQWSVLRNKDRNCFAGGMDILKETEGGVLSQAAWAPVLRLQHWLKQAG